MTNRHFPFRVLKKVKDYTIFPIVWMNEVRRIFENKSRTEPTGVDMSY